MDMLLQHKATINYIKSIVINTLKFFRNLYEFFKETLKDKDGKPLKPQEGKPYYKETLYLALVLLTSRAQQKTYFIRIKLVC